MYREQHILIWLACWILFLFVQAIVINGIKSASEGETEVMPNGRDKDSEMIFYPFAKWITQYSMVLVYYEGLEFAKLWDRIKKRYAPLLAFQYQTDLSGVMVTTEIEPHMIKLADIIEQELGVKYLITHNKLWFYKEYKRYRFGKFVRMPLIQCIKCMSSFWSITLTFLPPMYIVFGWHWWLFPLLVINILSLTYVNKLIYKS